jgi:hypothetical protein
MIRIRTVQGDVLVEDRKKGYMLMAQPGMALEDRGDILVVTNSTSRATINMDGTDIRLEPLSYFRIRPTGRTWWERHGLPPGGDTRVWIGTVWAKLGGPTNDTPTANAAVGVRG